MLTLFLASLSTIKNGHISLFGIVDELYILDFEPFDDKWRIFKWFYRICQPPKHVFRGKFSASVIIRIQYTEIPIFAWRFALFSREFFKEVAASEVYAIAIFFNCLYNRFAFPLQEFHN